MQRQILAGVAHGQLGAGTVAKDEGDVGVVGVDDQPEAAPSQPEPQPRDAVGQLRIDGQDALVVA
ncbi:Uncharacterised protein [Mycobacterium tuberculosis]|uniref:Uncharacterized protein n=1 Tax=Mycobacterium tuberculosis TaxID=1773 RepID=A0A0T9YWQ7_MYCTX|nr:Uncharacterised protein [Mycobacterium tuberculosis]CFR96956.1 Uncharacterised protein [Mycobacterium tuberculosis]CFS05039.1 Uncharacterised protein [Mycobacterium tuberculosis]CKM47311.1 Uncharacterised protein [Mycobacterium tuberculosis]CKM93475.1 Uncharacterised protein [Mycobacterium tuberculosis]